MPFLEIQTQVELVAEERAELLQRVSYLVSDRLGKPEAYVMCSLRRADAMIFAGSAKSCCCVSIRVIGALSGEVMTSLNQALCTELERALSIPKERTFVTFEQVPRHHWGIRGDMLA